MSDRPSLVGAFQPKSHRPQVLRRDDDKPEIRIDTTPAGAVHNVAVYLPVALRNEVRDRARQRGLTITDLVEEAFAQHGSNYHELTAQPVHRPGSMPTRAAARRGHGTIQIQLRLDDRQHEWLDDQVTCHGAPNRSALVTAVLTRHLGL